MRFLMLNLTASALLIFASAAHASPVEFVIGTSSTVDVTYFGLGSSYSYSVTGSISAEVTDTSVIIIGGTLDLVGSGPDSSMTITGGELSHDGAGFFWDFGQGPFDAGVPTENPGYILDSTGFTGTLGDMFGNFSLGGFFGGEGFGLADDGSTHSMSSFFWNGDAVVVPVPTAVWLFGSALAGLGLLRRRR